MATLDTKEYVLKSLFLRVLLGPVGSVLVTALTTCLGCVGGRHLDRSRQPFSLSLIGEHLLQLGKLALLQEPAHCHTANGFNNDLRLMFLSLWPRCDWHTHPE